MMAAEPKNTTRLLSCFQGPLSKSLLYPPPLPKIVAKVKVGFSLHETERALSQCFQLPLSLCIWNLKLQLSRHSKQKS